MKKKQQVDGAERNILDGARLDSRSWLRFLQYALYFSRLLGRLFSNSKNNFLKLDPSTN